MVRDDPQNHNKRTSTGGGGNGAVRGMLNGLDLFSGIGGLTIALADWVKPVAYCESDRYAQSVLLSRMSDGTLPIAPIWDDVRTLRAGNFRLCKPIDIIYGGFPCQDISIAGRRKGLAGERSGLFFEIIRLVREIRPRFIFLENVSGITSNGLDEATKELAAIRYDCRWEMLTASSLGAPHKRERWFCLAHAVGERLPQLQKREEITKGSGERAANSCSWWDTEPDVGRVANGIPNRVDRLRVLGNAVVPQQAKEAFERLIGFKRC